MSNVAVHDTTVKHNYREFWLRRIHSLTGFLPLSVFVITHFLGNMNSTVRDGGIAFNEYGEKLHELPFFNFLELGIIIPIIYHAVYGLYRTFSREKWNTTQYPNESNWRYFWQRITGIYLFVYIIIHVWETRIYQMRGGTVDFNFMAEHLRNPIYATLYILAIAASAFHLANGLWGFLITWGVTVGQRAQAMSAKICLATGVLVFLLGINAFLGFFDYGIAFTF